MTTSRISAGICDPSADYARTEGGLQVAREMFGATSRALHATFDERRELYDEMLTSLPRPTPTDASVRPRSFAGVSCIEVTSAGADPSTVVIYFHGGGYVMGSARGYVGMGWGVSRAFGARVVVVDYRRAPEHPYPAAVDDAMGVTRDLLADPSVARVCVMGDSAGGGLALGASIALRDRGLPLPSAIVGVSPMLDLTASSASLQWRAESEFIVSRAGVLKNGGGVYLGEHDARATPWASPAHGDGHGLPPTLLMAGSDEGLLGDTLGMFHKIVDAGGEAQLLVEPFMFHCWPLFWASLPQAWRALTTAAEFVHGAWTPASTAR